MLTPYLLKEEKKNNFVILLHPVLSQTVSSRIPLHFTVFIYLSILIEFGFRTIFPLWDYFLSIVLRQIAIDGEHNFICSRVFNGESIDGSKKEKEREKYFLHSSPNWVRNWQMTQDSRHV